jgi:Flp pilus assembly protein TadD
MNTSDNEKPVMHTFKSATAILGATCFLLIAGCADDGAGGPAHGGTTVKKDAPAKVAADIADHQMAAGDPASAAAYYRRAVEIDPDQPKTQLALADALVDAGGVDEAAGLYRKVLAKDGSNDRAMSGLGVALVRQGQPQQAAEMLRKGIDKAPSPRAYRALGVADSMLGSTDAAEADFAKGLSLAPADVGLRANLGLAQAINGKFEPAIANLRAAASGPSSSPQYRQNLALGLGLAGRTDEAAQIAQIDLDPKAAHSNLAYYAQLRTMTPAERARSLFHVDVAPQPLLHPPK